MMKTNKPFILIAVLLIVCAIALWLALTHNGKIKREEDEEKKERTTSTKIGKEKEIRLPKIVLSMDINGRERQEIVEGTPLFIKVALRNASAQEAARIEALFNHYNNKEYPETKKEEQKKIIDFLRYELENISSQAVELNVKKDRLEEVFSFQILSNGKYQPLPWKTEWLKSSQDQKVNLDDKDMLIVEFAVSPENAGEILPGKHTIRAKLLAGLASEINDGMESDKVTLKIIKEEYASSTMLKERSLLCERYYLKKGDLARAEQLAKQLMDKEPDYLSGWILLGSIEEEMGKNDEAYLAYQEAMNIVAKKDCGEPPQFLIEKINKYLSQPMK